MNVSRHIIIIILSGFILVDFLEIGFLPFSVYANRARVYLTFIISSKIMLLLVAILKLKL